jgi:hypothetical protein
MTYASTISRTRHAERFFEAFLALPLVSEFVFRSPQIVDTTQKEVADLLVSQTGASILLSLKCQGDPARRDAIKTTSWANKQARKALNQLRGALRTQKGKALVRSRAPGASLAGDQCVRRSQTGGRPTPPPLIAPAGPSHRGGCTGRDLEPRPANAPDSDPADHPTRLNGDGRLAHLRGGCRLP